MSEHSPELNELAAALSRAQGEFPAIPKTADNPFFKSKFADLPTVVEAASPILAKHGLSVSQTLGYSDGVDTLTTYLLHSSGQFMADTMRLHLVKTDPQGHGSATTYARRYSYMSVLGLVADEDDDGNKANTPARAAPRRPARQPEQPEPRPPDSDPRFDVSASPEAIRPQQLTKMHILFKDKHPEWDRTDALNWLATLGILVESSKELSKDEASRVLESLMRMPGKDKT